MLRPTTKSYVGRQLDVELLEHVEDMLPWQRVHPLVVGDYDTGRGKVEATPRIVAGIEKAVQRYAKLFLTNLGSVKLAPNVGSHLLPKVQTGQVSNLAYFDHLCSIANVHALLAMEEDDQDTDSFGAIPDDERIVSTRITNLSLDRAASTARVSVFITTAAGDSFTFVIPVKSGIN